MRNSRLDFDISDDDGINNLMKKLIPNMPDTASAFRISRRHMRWASAWMACCVVCYVAACVFGFKNHYEAAYMFLLLSFWFNIAFHNRSDKSLRVLEDMRKELHDVQIKLLTK